MPELPALPLQAPVASPRQTGSARRPRIEGPGAARQRQRLGGAFQRLTAAFDAQRIQVVGDPDALEPDRVLILEIAGEIDEFVRAVQQVPGLEYLAEEVEDKIDPDEFAAVDRQGRRHRYARQLFLVASDATAWHQLLSLWQRFQRGEDFPRGFAKFRDLFARLRDLRPWDDHDRLERTGALEAWQRELAELRDEPVEFEIELWLRSSQQRRTAAVANLRTDLRDAGGELVGEVVHEEIDYHGVLGRVPAHRLRDAVARHEVRWLRTGGVRFFHAVGQMAAPITADAVEPEPAEAPGAPVSGQARVALLDGLPLGGHTLLRGRLVIDDPEGWDATIPAARRVHGTGMASVVVHGDLNGTGVPLNTPVYVRPILSSNAPDWVHDAREELPRDRLAVDVVSAAVARLFEGDAVAPGVRAIVLAIGDTVLQFDRFVSPLARLIDWLAFRHDVVFLVSAGNHTETLDIPADAASDDAHELQHELLCALGRSAATRRLLAPAESINAVTVGAAHDDESAHAPSDDRVEPIITPDLPNLGSAIGAGARRAVKPDVLLPGGRQLIRLEPPSNGRRLATIPPSRRPPGVRLAAPGQQAGILDATVYDTGTSIAAATAGHHSGHLVDELAALRMVHGDTMPGSEFDAVLLKPGSTGLVARFRPGRKEE